MPKVGIVADDVTGATTVGALLSREGATATVLFDSASLGSHAHIPEDSVVIVSTASRALEADEAYACVNRTTQALANSGVSHFSKRIDTTFRGKIGSEIEGMLSALGDDYIAVVVPAMPQSRRVVVGGYSLIDSVLLAQTSVAYDVRTPVRESYLPELLQEQMTETVYHISLKTISDGAHAIAGEMRSILAHGGRAIILDAVSVEDIDEIALAALSLGRRILAVDPGPFTQRIVVHSAVIPLQKGRLDEEKDARKSNAGVVIAIIGSATEVTHHQLLELMQESEVSLISVDPLAAIGLGSSFPDECQKAACEAAGVVKAETSHGTVIVTLGSTLAGEKVSQQELEIASGITGGDAAELLVTRFGGVARAVADEIGVEKIKGFYLTGGDVMVKTLQALDAQGLRLVDYFIPQVDYGLIVGGSFDGIPVVCKGGLTGDKFTAVNAVRRIHGERN